MIGSAALAVALPPIGYAMHRWRAAPAAARQAVAIPARPAPPPAVRFAEFNGTQPRRDVKQVADWVADAGDNHALPFAILDKTDARVWVFDPGAHLVGSSPVLLGLAIGDDSVPGIGEHPIAQVRPEERTTPAGRFETEPGRNTSGEDVIWVDYEAAVSMHRVRPINPKERRLERLASATPADNRISYGCINVPVAFFEAVVQPLLARGPALVYVLPETRSLDHTFRLYDVSARATALARKVPSPASAGEG